MILSEADSRLYYKLHPSVLLYANHQCSVFKDIKTLDDFMKVDIKKKVTVRNELYENIQILDQFYKENPENYTEKELSIILSWKHLIKARFFVYKQYKKYCVFLHQEGDTKAFGVLGLTDSKHYRKRFKALGIGKAWFAILDGVVVGSGRSKAEAEENAKRVLSDDLKDYYVLFEVK